MPAAFEFKCVPYEGLGERRFRLRDVLRLTGTKYSGEHGEGGYDLVLVDGKLASATNLPVVKLAGKTVTTVEGLAAADGKLHPLQQAFVDEDAIGCGYCTPGPLLADVAGEPKRPECIAPPPPTKPPTVSTFGLPSTFWLILKA